MRATYQEIHILIIQKLWSLIESLPTFLVQCCSQFAHMQQSVCRMFSCTGEFCVLEFTTERKLLFPMETIGVCLGVLVVKSSSFPLRDMCAPFLALC